MGPAGGGPSLPGSRGVWRGRETVRGSPGWPGWTWPEADSRQAWPLVTARWLASRWGHPGGPEGPGGGHRPPGGRGLRVSSTCPSWSLGTRVEGPQSGCMHSQEAQACCAPAGACALPGRPACRRRLERQMLLSAVRGAVPAPRGSQPCEPLTPTAQGLAPAR